MEDKKRIRSRIPKREKELLKIDPYCPNCNEWLGADETGYIKLKYCKDCGAELLRPAYCVVCNNIIMPKADYCSGCGFIAIR